MEYPDNFETPVNPAGKSIAVSRIMAIWTLVCFLLIVFLCGILIWSARSERMEPFIISINNDTGDWGIVGQKSNSFEYSRAQSIQESVVVNFIRDWFSISDDVTINNEVWKKCDRTDCFNNDSLDNSGDSCKLYCATDDVLFAKFSNDILPDYKLRATDLETWSINDQSITIKSIGDVSDFGGNWHAVVKVYSNKNGPFDIEIFIKTARNKKDYPKNLGFYITAFNSYRIN